MTTAQAIQRPTFSTAMRVETGLTSTQNGAVAHKSTLNACLDMFAKIAACRDNLPEAQTLFAAALKEDKELALRILFWCRDIRGGAGERRIFRHLLTTLAQSEPQFVIAALPIIAEYGRFDDILALEETPVSKDAAAYLHKIFKEDLAKADADGSITLLGKWLPSINASSKATRRIANELAKAWGLTQREYRKSCVKLRTKIKIVETLMCQQRWDEIDYQSVPSRAAMIYRKAFGSHDESRYGQYLQDVADGKQEIKAGTLYPYDLVRNAITESNQTIDLQWKNLPDFMPTEGFNGLVVADVSGSMMVNNSLPLHVSISLAMYISERNTHPAWRDQFLTFSADPQFQQVKGDTLFQRVQSVARADWGYNTNLEKTFQTILDAAKRQNLKPQDMPAKLIIVSDMEFDRACCFNTTTFENIQKMYKASGYAMPKLTFWNVNAGNHVPFTVHETGALLVSGCSPSVLKAVLNDQIISATDLMMEVVGVERYQPVADALQASIQYL